MLVQILIICNVNVNVSWLKSTTLLLSSSKKMLLYSKQICLFFYNELFLVRKTLYTH